MSFWNIAETVFIGPLKLIFEYIFYFARAVVGSPGLAIIALSLAMNILVLPLYRRADLMQETARDVENKLSKGVAHIKKVFSGDERMMILQTYYRQNDYKPTDALKGSVSLLLEVPFFMAAYQFLSTLTILENSSFGPISDLSLPDGLLVIGGVTVNLLPVLMTLINVISSAIYLKGFPLKTKIQLYGMALFFLVFLYQSPAGLVFYWTLNNVFSLCKTIFYKLKNPRRTGKVLLFAVGAVMVGYGLFFYDAVSFKRRLFVVLVGAAALLLPLVGALISRLPKPRKESQTNRRLFVLCGVFLTVLIGLLIPSAVIAASPQEFVDPSAFYHPLLYVLHTLCMAAGTFLVWMQVFYWLAGNTGKAVFEKTMWILCGCMLVTYLFFGTDLGVLSPTLKYEVDMTFSAGEQLVNLAVLAVVAAAMLLALRKWQKPAASALLIVCLVVTGMAGVNMAAVGKSVQRFTSGEETAVESRQASFPLSQTGQNVVVIMLDRAMGDLVPYLLQEKPELKDQFDGFTFYENAVSFGANTNFALPALLGGYEYTPVALNQRDDMPLKEKHNEALKLMPVLFGGQGYEVTVCDPVYANYEWIPDLSIYDDVPHVEAYITEGEFTPGESYADKIRVTSRNFFCFSLMKTLPLPLQGVVYGYGNYNQLGSRMVQTATGLSVAHGNNGEFLDAYYVLYNMSEMTNVTAEKKDTFLLLFNNTTHEPCLLQTPDYTPADSVYNVDYDEAHGDRFNSEKGSIELDGVDDMGHYHINMAALLRLGEWFDHLRENGVYDNTRIILVADHSTSLSLDPEHYYGSMDLGRFFPLLMVKDFDASGFSVSDEFMTNADVPTLAMDDLIADPVNPFTGNPVNTAEKTAHPQYIILSDEWQIEVNNGETFLPAQWASVEKDWRDADNWKVCEEKIVLDRHAMP